MRSLYLPSSPTRLRKHRGRGGGKVVGARALHQCLLDMTWCTHEPRFCHTRWNQSALQYTVGRGSQVPTPSWSAIGSGGGRVSFLQWFGTHALVSLLHSCMCWQHSLNSVVINQKKKRSWSCEGECVWEGSGRSWRKRLKGWNYLKKLYSYIKLPKDK